MNGEMCVSLGLKTGLNVPGASVEKDCPAENPGLSRAALSGG